MIRKRKQEKHQQWNDIQNMLLSELAEPVGINAWDILAVELAYPVMKQLDRNISSLITEHIRHWKDND